MRVKQAQANGYGLQEEIPLKYKKQRIILECYVPYGKHMKGEPNRHKSANQIDWMKALWIIADRWIEDKKEELYLTLKQCNTPHQLHRTIRRFIDYMWNYDAIVRVFYECED